MTDPNPLPDVEVKEGDVLAGKYRVEKVLGVGGMGVVVSATHTVLQSRVALKFLLPSVAKHEQTAARFLREAQAAVRIKSPHVARVIDVGQMEDTGSPYMVMEFLEGRDVGEVIDAEGSLDVERACLFALQTCEALAAAHATGIVHRDIKPANLFLTQSTEGTPLIKVLDFGISKNTTEMGISSLTQTQVSMGSPLYMSPEQMRSARDVDSRADIWSVGVVLFEMLTGQLPFMAETMPQLCALVLEDVAPRVDAFRSDVPEGLADVIAKCLEKSRDQRFSTVAQLAEALAPYVPYWGEQSAERTSRIVAGAKLGKTSAVPPVPAGRHSPAPELVGAGPSPLRRTKTAFGRTGEPSDAGPAPRAVRNPWLAVAALAVLAGGVGAFFYLLKAEEADKPAASAGPAVTNVASGRAAEPEKTTSPLAATTSAPDVATATQSATVPASSEPAVAATEGGQRTKAPPTRKGTPKPAGQPKKPSDPFGERF